MRLRSPALLLAGLAACVLAACGASAPARPAPVAPTAAASPSLSVAVVTRELGNGLRAALGRRAVLEQGAPDASSLAADLPTGTVQDVRCSAARRPADARVRWSCAAAWRTPSGMRERARYDVRVERGACAVAVARPQRPTRYDRNARSYTEDPLNVLTSARRGC